MKIFHLPDLGEGLTEAEIHEWHVKEGDTVETDELMVSMETAKAVVEVPAPRSGKITKLYGKAGDTIDTHGALVEFEDDDGTAEVASGKEGATVAGSIEVGQTILEESAMGVTPQKSGSTTRRVLPAVRSLAKRLNVDLDSLQGTGPNDQITAEDVKRASESGTSQVPTVKGEKIHGVRRTMAKAMSESHAQVVPVTLVDDANITAWSDKTDITARLIRAINAGCQQEPTLNAWFDGKNLSLEFHKAVHLGIAVDTPDGLFVPVIKDTQKKDAKTLREAINHIKDGVKSRQIPANELQGATFTLSNFGIYAGRYANPIVVPPTVAILGSGKLREEMHVIDGKPQACKLMPLSLTFDHRAATGGEASRFLKAVLDDLAKAN